MKNIIRYTKLMTIVLIAALTSCEYQDIADADYPDQLIYMPAATNGIFYINTVPTPNITNPTPGNNYRYKIDEANNKFIVPLSAYRSGVNNKGSFTVDIVVNNDTISQLLTTGALPSGTLQLPSDKYSISSSVEMKNGEELAPFDLSIDLSFLKANSPGKNYAIAVTISSDARETNPALATTIIVIGTDILSSTAALYGVESNAPSILNILNCSNKAIRNSWHFGVGDAIFTQKDPTLDYSNSGESTVKLIAFLSYCKINRSIGLLI